MRSRVGRELTYTYTNIIIDKDLYLTSTVTTTPVLISRTILVFTKIIDTVQTECEKENPFSLVRENFPYDLTE